MREIKIGSSVYRITDGPDAEKQVFDKLISWMSKKGHYAAHSGEGIMQDDNCQTDAPELISDMVDDILKPIYMGES